MNTTTLAIVALIAVAALTVGFYAAVQNAQADSIRFRQGGNQRSSCTALVVSRAGCGNNDQENNFRVD